MNRVTANDENVAYLNGKRVLAQNVQQNKRRPLGTYALTNVAAADPKKDSEYVKKRPEGVQTRSQAAKQEVHEGVGHAVPHSQPGFTIYEDAGHGNVVIMKEEESMDIVEEKLRNTENIMPWSEIRPNVFDEDLKSEHCVQYGREEVDDDGEEMGDCEEEEEEDEEDEDISVSENMPGDDSEMLNAHRKQKAGINDKYANEHLMYSLNEYRCDIYKNMREKELNFLPNPDYMRKQTDINNTMRSILVDWMVEVADEYRLKRETLFLAVNYVDRFLSFIKIARSKLQLVGTAALFIASKYEEVYPPSIGEFVSITDGTYTNKQVLQMEYTMLKTLKFRTTVPTSNFFCLELLNQLSMEEIDYAMAFYILETSLVISDEFLAFRPSILATSSVFMSSLILRREDSMNQITPHTSYGIEDLLPCITLFYQAFQNSEKLSNNAVRTKYQTPRYHSVSRFVIPKELTIQNFLTGNY